LSHVEPIGKLCGGVGKLSQMLLQRLNTDTGGKTQKR
jgi:hypothetical protein